LVAACLAAILSRFYEVELISDRTEFTLGDLASAFSLDLEQVKQRSVAGLSGDGFEIPGKLGAFGQIKRSRAIADSYDLFVYCGHGVPPFCRGKRGLIYCHFPRQPAPRIGLGESEQWARRNRLDRALRSTAYDFLWRVRMRPYKAVLANSSFTAHWVERYWGLPAEVVYPPIEMTVPEAMKRNLIASVGRFDGCFRRGKEQLAQVTAFREFLAKVGGDWKICLIGSCHTPEEKAYLARVQQAAEGLPATFMVNADRDAICRTLAESKLFWHTQGLSSDDTKYPWEAEHFGIATVEAMRAGCVPVVIASGGQKEIVEQGVSGFLCKDLLELVEKSAAVALGDHLLRSLSERAKQRSMAFTREIFERRVMQIVSQCLPV
jgi:glycosyltransferase involved in cell wall biosynthesis